MFKIKLPLKKETPSKPASVVGLRRLTPKRNKRFSRKKIYIILIPFFLILIFLGVFLLLKYNPWQIKIISFQSADLSCATNQQLKDYLGLNKYNLLNLNTNKLEQQAKEHFVCLSSIQIIKKFPSEVDIAADDHQAAALIRVFQIPQLDLNLEDATSSTEAAKIVDNTQTATLAGNFVVDQQGFVISFINNQSNLPIFDYYNQGKEIKLGSRLPDGVISNSLKAVNGLNQQKNIKNAKIIEENLYLSGDNQYIFSLSKDIEHQLVALQLILHQATIDSKSIQKVDLRFDKAVVVYSAR